jgi:hypothetical protein
MSTIITCSTPKTIPEPASPENIPIIHSILLSVFNTTDRKSANFIARALHYLLHVIKYAPDINKFSVTLCSAPPIATNTQVFKRGVWRTIPTRQSRKTGFVPVLGKIGISYSTFC